MSKRGAKRSSTKKLPKGIRIEQLPDRVYWNASGRGHWYTSYFDATGTRRTKKLAGPSATLADLHRLMEEQSGIKRNTFTHISEQFQATSTWRNLAKSTREGYLYCHNILANYPTKIGTKLGDASLDQWNTPMVQRFVDRLTDERGPTSAKHTLAYARRVFSWAVRRGHALSNPCKGVEAPKERKKRVLPTDETYSALLDFAKTFSPRPYIWMVMELAYLCRMRGIEVLDLTDANNTEQGVLVKRRKQSRSTIVTWNDRLRAVWAAAVEYRAHVLSRLQHSPLPIDPNDQRLFLSKRTGAPLTKGGFNTGWQVFITAAIQQGIIDEADRFAPHDLKRKGVTDTKGNRSDKQQASGHRAASMMDVYDMEIPVVTPAGSDSL